MKPEHKFWNRFAEKYASRPIADRQVYDIKLEITREYLKPDMRVLEFGCGTGKTAISHEQYVSSIEGIDAAPNMIMVAKRNADDQATRNVSFKVMDFEKVPTNAERYDAVLGLNVLHLLNDRDAAIARVFKLLTPGGVFVSSTPCLGDKLSYLKLLKPLGSLGLIPKLQVFTSAELDTSIVSAGFDIIHYWQPSPKKAVFIVAQKLAGS
ncbi:MAG: class I SAM-dependent methyltransferase [Pseudomonadota bacterium]